MWCARCPETASPRPDKPVPRLQRILTACYKCSNRRAWAPASRSRMMCAFDECGKPRRRSFLAMAAGGVVSLAAVDALAAEAPPSRSTGAETHFPSSVGEVRAYLATPRARGRRPAVLVLHAQLGLPD